MDGLLNVCKPQGLTSFQVVKQIRGILKVKKAGHCGTLDPMATGVLLVVFGKATKQATVLSGQDKVYRAEIRLGQRTDTGDITGNIMEESLPPVLTLNQVQSVLQGFIGISDQIPPMVSALKYGGHRLYDLARQGRTVERSPRKINIESLELLRLESPILEIRVRCSKGTYIRTLAEDIGRVLGVPATLQSLEREKSGNFNIQDSIPWDKVVSSNTKSLLQFSSITSPRRTSDGEPTGVLPPASLEPPTPNGVPKRYVENCEHE